MSHRLMGSDYEPHEVYGFLVARCSCGWRYKHRRRKVVDRAWTKHLEKNG